MLGIHSGIIIAILIRYYTDLRSNKRETMRLTEFLSLSKLEQSRIIGCAAWISSKRKGTIVTVLYKVDDFHVEAVYRRKNMELLELMGVTDTEIINSYSMNTHINPFTLSNYQDLRSGTYDHRFTFNR
jgi:hypothetical protein